MTAAWVYPETQPYQVQGRDLSEDNFAQEERSSLEILIREALQNPIDARDPGSTTPVKVRISILKPGSYDADYLARILDEDYGARLEQSGADPLPDIENESVLVLEDFSTTGLEGSWCDPNADGPGENWNAFWFREGEGAKATGSNGRAGQGKITYYRVGAARAVFGFTVRKSDSKKLLMGRSAFRRVYPYQGKKYLRHSFWCTGVGQPVTDVDEIMAFRAAFKLARLSEPGLSLVIPFPKEFEAAVAIQTIITDFYYPIACGHLELLIGGVEFTAENIDSMANQVLTDELARQKRSSFTKGYRSLVRSVIVDMSKGITPVVLKEGWDKTSSIPEDALPEGELEKLRAAVEKGGRVSLRCPVTIRPRREAVVKSWFDVHLEIPEDLERVEEAYIRRDLLIGSENHLSSSSYLQKARALTLVVEDKLSAFLADAEEPTHLKWNASRPRLAEDYMNPQATLRAVRNAAPRLLALVSNGLVKQDIKALAKYFTKPVDDDGKKGAAGGKQNGIKVPPVGDPPPSVRKPFRISTDVDAVHVLPNGNAGPVSGELPLSCSLEIAYEGLDQDPFKEYDPFDFDLSEEKTHPVEVKGASISSRRGNRIEFEVTDPDFKLDVSGFDSNIRLRARLIYKEKDDGASISEE
jgi:hypothetical protein